ncbi:MAG: NAD-binding protein [Planctomycetota bacterium]|nr:NAD-binding protein [Planctomycetota bacterium]
MRAYLFGVVRLQGAGDRKVSWRERLWREWCFLRAVAAHRAWSLGILAGLLVGGGWAFRVLDPGREMTFVESVYRAWSLVFGEATGPFPRHWLLEILYFLIPVLGLTVVIEAIVEASQMVRDRRRGEAEWCRIMADSMKDHVILVGLGKLGIRVFHILRGLDQRVVVLERDEHAQFLEDVRRDGSPLFLGDARRDAFLVDAGVGRARSIVLSTDDDLTNLEIALDARRLNPKIRVVLRMFDPNMADKVRDGFQIRAVMSSSELSAPAFAVAALERNIVASSVIGGVLVVTQRCIANAGGPLAGRTVGDLARAHGIGIVERRPKTGPQKLFPSPETTIEAGDEVLVQGPFDVLERIDFGAQSPVPSGN